VYSSLPQIYLRVVGIVTFLPDDGSCLAFGAVVAGTVIE
jgi:hypothetical protein